MTCHPHKHHRQPAGEALMGVCEVCWPAGAFWRQQADCHHPAYSAICTHHVGCWWLTVANLTALATHDNVMMLCRRARRNSLPFATCKGMTMSVAVVVAVAAVVKLVASVVGKPIISMVAAMTRFVNGWDHFGRRSDCTGQRPGSLLRTYVGCQTPSEWTQQKCTLGDMCRQPRRNVPCPWPLRAL